MSDQSSSDAPTSMPRPLLWGITVCLITLAAIALIAVARLAGFDPEQLITLVRQAESVVSSVRG